MIASETRETPSLRPGFLAAFLCVLTLAALSGTEAGAVGRGALESAVAQYLRVEQLPLANPTDGQVLGYDSATKRAVWQDSSATIGGSLGATDNVLLRSDGTGGVTAQGSDATMDDSELLDLTATGALALGTGANDPRLVRTATDTVSVQDGSANYGSLNAQTINLTDGANNRMIISNAVPYINMGSAVRVGWSSTSTSGALDTALSRLAAETLFVENGSGSGAQLVASNVRSTSGGSASVPSYAHNSNTNCGLWFNANGVTPSLATVGRPSFTAGHQVTLTDNTATTIATIALASGARCGGTVNWSVDVTDGTDHQVVTGSFTFSAVDKAGTLTSDVDADATVSTAASAGTCTVTPTILDGTNQISLQITADTSLSPTAMLVRFNMDLSGTSAATVTLP